MPPKKRTKPTIAAPWLADSGLPNCQTDPMDWIHESDAAARRRFDPSLPLEPDRTRGQPEAFFESMMNPDVLQEIVSARRFACVSHQSLSIRIVNLLTECDFEKTWLALGSEGQLKHFIVGFQKLEEQSGVGMPMFSGTKVDAPELCLDEISRDGGRGFLDLLNVFLLPNNDETPKQPFAIPNKRYDALIGWREDDTCPNRKAWIGLRRITRTRYISSFLGIVLHSTLGHNITLRSFTHEHHKTKETLLNMKPIMNTFLGESDANKWQKEQTDRRKDMKLFCDSCLKPEEKIENGKMSVCSPCKAVGRDVRYCDRVCQKDAWKLHKQLCGQPLGLDSAFDDIAALPAAPGSTTRPDVPPPTPGYRRSADLLRQITFLHENPTKDYVVVVSSDANYLDMDGISLDEPQSAALFIIMRSYAMSSAGPRAEAALLYVYRVLQRFGGDDAVLRTQLRKEYGKTFDNMAAALRRKETPTYDQVSREQMDTALSHLQKLGRFEEELSEFTVGSGENCMLGIQVGPKREVTVIVQYPLQITPPSVDLTPITSTNKRPTSQCVGPNFKIPKPPSRDGYTRSAAHEKQIRFLQLEPKADYVLWGTVDAPGTPYAVTFTGLKESVRFLAFRQRLFAHGAYELDALVFLMLMLEPAVRGRKIPREAVRAQLAREYGEDYVEAAVESIVKENGKSVYKRRDGDTFQRDKIPAKETDFPGLTLELKKVGRFPDLLKHLQQ
ncbi:hypothetical protein C8R46DRAFT_1347583 [Mycena filopes]|nr:hypothetical protein C8R46DRAFT_1347583 [Mycena filopes]